MAENNSGFSFLDAVAREYNKAAASGLLGTGPKVKATQSKNGGLSDAERERRRTGRERGYKR